METIGVPVVREEPSSRPKDVRRRWAEAMSWVHARYLEVEIGVVVAWLAVAGLIDHLTR